MRRTFRFHPTLVLLLLLLLTACGGFEAPLTFDQAQATAQRAGCWPGSGQTPIPVTVTPWGGFSATPDPALPTPTLLPTTTPYPYCTPEPGQPTRAPVTPLPTQAPYPTSRTVRGQYSETNTTVMHLAETVLQVDVAVHPSGGWPAVAAVAAPLVVNDDPRVFVRVLNPTTGRWGSVRSLGAGTTSLARTRFRTVQVGIAGDNSIVAVWGVVGTPTLGLLSAVSRDYGETWSAPEPIASHTYGVRDLAVLPDGRAAVVAVSEKAPQHPILIRREADRTWLPPEPLPSAAWYGSDIALTLRETGDGVQIVAALTNTTAQDSRLTLLARNWTGNSWITNRMTLPAPDDAAPGLLTHLRMIPTTPTGAFVTVSMAGRSVVYATATDDAGATWTPAQIIAQQPTKIPPYLASAFDATANQAISFWTCCEDATFIGAESTHYVTWGNPSIGAWTPQPGNLPPALITGALSAADTASAQAGNYRQVWIVWAEQVHQVEARAVDLSRIVPPSEYPTPTLSPIQEAQP